MRAHHVALVLCLALAVSTGAVPSSDADPDALTPEQLEQEIGKIQEEVEKLRIEHAAVFTDGDTDKDGKLSHPEFVVIQKKEDPDSTEDELAESFSDHDKDGSGHLSLDEWNQPFEDTVAEMLKTSDEHGMNEQQRMEHHISEFKQYDKNEDGFLDLAELEPLAKHVIEAGEIPPEEHSQITADTVLSSLDIDMDGKVSMEEYLLEGTDEEDEEMYGAEDDEDDSGIEGDNDSDLSIEDVTGEHGLEDE
eukprot:CAMPEP_0173389842 /NCGR_PEP_ID=MMETSP1356-20130122/13664_1 /TAXON_ID=77927 ORGANISM="Hemiselmis virescens, Strain PCC157" /NCGR_SAMPLE_ID=MMETSP1356 /ASSEMBLY_ACC=CAM_ASM_000847 /LENGTH=248 /DNA_ID=CAMNT_0014347105 /DNA_START=36 /DNA_END=782 /DNA_ORIENTATION=+